MLSNIGNSKVNQNVKQKNAHVAYQVILINDRNSLAIFLSLLYAQQHLADVTNETNVAVFCRNSIKYGYKRK